MPSMCLPLLLESLRTSNIAFCSVPPTLPPLLPALPPSLAGGVHVSPGVAGAMALGPSRHRLGGGGGPLLFYATYPHGLTMPSFVKQCCSSTSCFMLLFLAGARCRER